ncbi:VOC family protein [Corallococcus sp. H22C18031201]|nr:VOC family protein [Citreicoccus inhibens]MBU8895272.1 VOC family protein [Citreicoccus inhibens]RJS26234.1 VOC family protein [Corallococcus sp. H22C18031201]
MTSFVKVLVTDAERSARFYEALGFERISAEPPFIRLRWGEQADLYLITPPPGVTMEGRKGMGVLLGFRTGEGGVDALLERARAQGAQADGPTRQPWHTREIIVTDPDGYRLNFIEPA